MKISIAWLNQYLEPSVESSVIAKRLLEQGFPIEETLSLANGDTMLDAEVTSNRSDCLSHIGVAREVAARIGSELKQPNVQVSRDLIGSQTAASLTRVENESEALCPVYTARVIQGVKVGPSPAWLVEALEAIGLRSVNNVVDVTNYVLMEMGQPLHAFDLNKLAEKRIVIRQATKGETFDAIDGSKHQLDERMLVIADAQKPVALAGVMGGLDSEVTEATTDLLLESAIFDLLTVRYASRKLKLSSDSSYRFERGVDPLGVELASRRAAQLIVEVAGGKIADGVIRVGEGEPEALKVTLGLSRCAAILGMTHEPNYIIELLNAIGLLAELDDATQTVSCLIPSWRGDIEREIDLIEEIARLHGLEKIPVNQEISIQARAPQPLFVAKQKLRQTLVAHGFFEAMTFSFIRPKLGKPFLKPTESPLLIDDERRKAEPMLRPSLLPSLLVSRKSNQDVGNSDVQLFETASVWSRDQEGEIVERNSLALIADAQDPQEAVSQLAGTCEELVGRLHGHVAIQIKPIELSIYRQAAEIILDGKTIGTFGLLTPKIVSQFDLQTSIVAAELDLPALLEGYPPNRQVQAMSRFPAIERDLSLIVREDVTWQQIHQEVLALNLDMLDGVEFVTTYRGKPIEKGAKSVSLRFVFKSANATLRHEQVDPQMKTVIEKLNQSLNATLRV